MNPSCRVSARTSTSVILIGGPDENLTALAGEMTRRNLGVLRAATVLDAIRFLRRCEGVRAIVGSVEIDREGGRELYQYIDRDPLLVGVRRIAVCTGGDEILRGVHLGAERVIDLEVGLGLVADEVVREIDPEADYATEIAGDVSLFDDLSLAL